MLKAAGNLDLLNVLAVGVWELKWRLEFFLLEGWNRRVKEHAHLHPILTQILERAL